MGLSLYELNGSPASHAVMGTVNIFAFFFFWICETSAEGVNVYHHDLNGVTGGKIALPELASRTRNSQRIRFIKPFSDLQSSARLVGPFLDSHRWHNNNEFGKPIEPVQPKIERR